MQRQSKIFSFFIIILIFNYSCVKKTIIQEGDLLFQDLDSSPLCDGIEQVTKSFNDMSFSHIGIVVNIDKEKYVLEAFEGVDTVKLEKFLNRSLNKQNQV